MTTPGHDGPGVRQSEVAAAARTPAARARDAGLRRVTRLTGWTAAGAIALTGAVAEIAAQAKPGYSQKAKRVTRARTAAASPVPSPQVVTPPAGGGNGQAAAPVDSGTPPVDPGTASAAPATAAPGPSTGESSGASSLQPPAQTPAPAAPGTSAAATSGGS